MKTLRNQFSGSLGHFEASEVVARIRQGVADGGGIVGGRRRGAPRIGNTEVVGGFDPVDDVTSPWSAVFGETQVGAGEGAAFIAFGEGVFDEVFHSVVVRVAGGATSAGGHLAAVSEGEIGAADGSGEIAEGIESEANPPGGGDLAELGGRQAAAGGAEAEGAGIAAHAGIDAIARNEGSGEVELTTGPVNRVAIGKGKICTRAQIDDGLAVASSVPPVMFVAPV